MIPMIVYCAVAAVTMAGMGLGALLVAAFTEAQRAVLTWDFPNNLKTQAMVSSIWTSTFTLGSFVGPTTGRALYDLVLFTSVTRSEMSHDLKF